MSQKTHPIGFRRGVPHKSNVVGYNQGGTDLHGSTSRWCVPFGGLGQFSSQERYADLTQRDRLLKNIVEQFLEEDGFVVNKCIVTRSTNYVGIYVDALRLEEPRLIAGIYGDQLLKRHVDLGAVGRRSLNSTRSILELENVLSRTIEYGTPVVLQIHELNQLEESNTVGDSSSVVGLVDLQNARKLSIPNSNLIAKIIAYRLSGGRRHRDVRRVVRKEVTKRQGVIRPRTKSMVESLGVEQVQTSSSLVPEERSTVSTNDLKLESQRVNDLSSRSVLAPINYGNAGGVKESQVANSSNTVNGKGVKLGFQRMLKGRIGGSERGRILRYRVGSRPRHTRSAAIDYGFSEVNTPSGKVSVTIRTYWA